jgi:hypothetical protein
MPNPMLPQYVAMDVYGTGVLVDVTQYVRGADGVTKTATRTDQFRDAAPATYTFTLENYDGRFTPGNPNSPYANTPTERMQVNWSVGGQYRAGAILTMTLQDDNWALLTITCDDQLGAASRNTITASIADAITQASTQLLMWRMDDAPTATSAVEASGNGAMVTTAVAAVLFGQTAIPGLPGTQLLVTS